jgi:dihydrofolate reductase
MKLTATMMLSLDGVYQGPGGPDEDRRGGFERGGWVAAFADRQMGPFLLSMFERADALLLGRRTWQIWEQYWPHHDDNPFGHRINVLPKYVPSTTLADPTWQNSHVISDDVEAAASCHVDTPTTGATRAISRTAPAGSSTWLMPKADPTTAKASSRNGSRAASARTRAAAGLPASWPAAMSTATTSANARPNAPRPAATSRTRSGRGPVTSSTAATNGCARPR